MGPLRWAHSRLWRVRPCHPERRRRRSSHDIVTMPAHVTDRRDARRVDHLPGRQGARRGRLPAVAGRGPRPHGRERCGQVHAHQGTDRRVCHRRGADLDRRRGAPAPRHRRRPDCRNLGRVPGSQPVLEPHDRRERDARSRGPWSLRDQVEGDASRRRAGARQARPPPSRHPAAAVVAVVGDAAIGGDQPRDGHRFEGAHPRRADVEPRCDRGRATVHRRATTARSRGGDPVRVALPRPGVRDQRPHHHPAQRRLRRRVPDGRTRPHRTDRQDDRQGAVAAPVDRRRASRTSLRPHGRSVARRHVARPQGGDRSDRLRDPHRRSHRIRRPARIRSHRAGPAAVRRRQGRLRHRHVPRRARRAPLAGRRPRPPHRLLEREPPRRRA